jgi:phage terminase small subunit
MRKHPAIVAALAAVGIGTKSAPTGKPEATPDESEPDIVTVEIPETEDPKVFLTALMNSPKAGVKARLEAAKALLPFEHSKIGEKGKKVTKAEGAKDLAEEGNTFGARKAPKLQAVPK